MRYCRLIKNVDIDAIREIIKDLISSLYLFLSTCLFVILTLCCLATCEVSDRGNNNRIFQICKIISKTTFSYLKDKLPQCRSHFLIHVRREIRCQNNRSSYSFFPNVISSHFDYFFTYSYLKKYMISWPHGNLLSFLTKIGSKSFVKNAKALKTPHLTFVSVRLA